MLQISSNHMLATASKGLSGGFASGGAARWHGSTSDLSSQAANRHAQK
jgi:hypothetical protein